MVNNQTKFSPEIRERAVRLLLEHRDEYASQWAAVTSIAPKIGCSPHSLLKWVRAQEVETGVRAGIPQAEQERMYVPASRRPNRNASRRWSVRSRNCAERTRF